MQTISPFLIFPETVLFCSSIIRRNIRKVLNSPTEYIVIYTKRGKNKRGQVFLSLHQNDFLGKALGEIQVPFPIFEMFHKSDWKIPNG